MEWRVRITWWIIFCIRYLRIFLVYYQKKHETVADNPSIDLHVNEIENRVTFKIKTGHYLELLSPEVMQLLGGTESKVTERQDKDKNGENVSYLEINEVVLIH